MPTLTITSRGQITLRRDLLQHLSVKPGECIQVDALPGGEVRLRAAPPARPIQDFVGLLKGRTPRAATLDEIEAAIQAGWAGRE